MVVVLRACRSRRGVAGVTAAEVVVSEVVPRQEHGVCGEVALVGNLARDVALEEGKHREEILRQEHELDNRHELTS